ncbi:MAG: UDP-N-acetylglucosamine 2-epimerase (non-hydrolyzing) [Candidatus Bathyarchaeota archaeon]
MALGIILGTRPEIIKMGPIIRLCEKRSVPYYLLHTGQHYSYEMDQAFFRDLELPEPRINLNVGSGTHAEQTASIMVGVEKTLQKEDTGVALVQGDTNTVLAGALAAAKLQVPVGHVEAGLHSYDRGMPEEINRVVADHLSDFLFAPTEESKRNLLKEGIPDERIHVTGNTVVDAVHQNLELAKEKSTILKKLSLEPGQYMVVTAHRAENVDRRDRLTGIIEGLGLVAEHLDQPIIYPVHPRTQKMIKEFRLTTRNLKIVQPLGYLDFLALEASSSLVLTDSGGVQEEACILGVPCVTLRENTERPETLQVGSNVLVGAEPERILQGALEMSRRKRGWPNPFGDGNAAEKIIKIIEESRN